ncbi:unnamed protein product [Blepharisma stoltei]|uniref:Uncharacterized protein n=1 Tax=Blepharisma stoltei TaxID=1481888 RepID=A0AAU9J1A7_9CILI|nr:unnamed protein product [Blepharisma stoltei]
MDESSEVHFYIMWFSFLIATFCFFSANLCGILNTKSHKTGIFLLLLISGPKWVKDVTALKNAPNFNELDIDPEKFYELRHNYSKLEMDVYIYCIEIISLFLIILLPYWHGSYSEKIDFLEKRVKEEEENYAKLLSSKTS